MNVYFTASIVGKQHYQKNYEKIIQEFTKQSAVVIADHIMRSTESSIRLEQKDQRLAFHQWLEHHIKTCDAFVAETSFPSISVGYEISLAMQSNKPILILYADGDPPSLLQDHKNEQIICEKYTLEGLPGLISDFMVYAKSGSDQRFTFYLTPLQATHLAKQAKISHVPKAVYLRNLLDSDMKFVK